MPITKADLVAFYAMLIDRFGIDRDIRIEVRNDLVYVYLDGNTTFDLGNAHPSFWTKRFGV